MRMPSTADSCRAVELVTPVATLPVSRRTSGTERSQLDELRHCINPDSRSRASSMSRRLKTLIVACRLHEHGRGRARHKTQASVWE